ncbi:MAG: hypothetical protein KGL39_09435 [Patescibacteria group bacterium]|nr:hypothetical protein [Patescibacteria group bacterium]
METVAGPSETEKYQFSVLDDRDHEVRSAGEVTSWELFNGTTPIAGGICSLLFGTTDHQWNCGTCSLGRSGSWDSPSDPGHPGILRLKVPVPDPLHIAEIRRWARVICLACGHPVIDPAEFAAEPPSRRLAAAANAKTEGVICKAIVGANKKVCNTVHPRIVKDKEDHFTFFAAPPRAEGSVEEKFGVEHKLQPHVLRAAFERVPDEVVIALGRRLDVHPRKLFHGVIQIPANTIRPGVRSAVGPSASYHDSTSILQYIVKRNQQLPSTIPDVITPELDKSIYNLIELYYNFVLGSASASVTQGSSGKRSIVIGTRPAPSIMRRLPRKLGRIRSNMLGKRVLYISRTTISGNTRLKINQVGIPKKYARKLQIRERVQEFNIERLTGHFLNGTRQYPGCTRVQKHNTGVVCDVENVRRDFRLEIGDYIWRDIVDGDVAFFNRQPSLEKSSIGVHEIVVLDDDESRTFQFNVSACAWYNADPVPSRSATGSCLTGGRSSCWGKQCKRGAYASTGRHITA